MVSDEVRKLFAFFLRLLIELWIGIRLLIGSFRFTGGAYKRFSWQWFLDLNKCQI